MKIKALQLFEQGLKRSMGGTFKLRLNDEVDASEADGIIALKLPDGDRNVPKPIIEKLAKLGYVQIT